MHGEMVQRPTSVGKKGRHLYTAVCWTLHATYGHLIRAKLQLLKTKAQTFRSSANAFQFTISECKRLLLHEIGYNLPPGLCIRQRNVESLDKPPPRSLINLLGSIGCTYHQQPILVTCGSSILESQKRNIYSHNTARVGTQGWLPLSLGLVVEVESSLLLCTF